MHFFKSRLVAVDGCVWRSSCTQVGQRAIPMHIQSGKHVVGDNDDRFLAVNESHGHRHFDHAVKFAQRFDDIPHVLVALTHIDIPSNAALTLQVTAEEISASGFVIRYTTRANTEIFGIGAQWIAFHPDLGDSRLPRRIL
jgi:phosphoribosyl 1,2-cyclic phosphodiesterase